MTSSLLTRDATERSPVTRPIPVNPEGWLLAREARIKRLRDAFRLSRSTEFTSTPRDAKCDALLAARQVDAGVSFLDAQLGRESWLDSINLDTLDVSSGLDCVVCQVTGLDFVMGMRLLGFGILHSVLLMQLGVPYGFAAPSARAYVALTAEWKSRVARLRVERVEVSA